MDIVKMIAELRAEKAAIEDALVVLERLASTRGKRRGRPPLWMAVRKGSEGDRAPRVFSAETRKKMAEAQRKRWAAYRKSQQTAASR